MIAGCTTGDIILAIAMTEANAGSDLQAIKTTAVKEGDAYIINGQKTFISNGISADVVIVACKTDPKAVPAHKGISLVVVEDGAPGFIKSRKLDKLGLHCQERLVSAIGSQAAAERMLTDAIEYAKTREAFGQPTGKFQHNAFEIAEMATEVELGRTFLDSLIADHIAGKDIVTKVSMAKWWISKMANRVAYNCLQLYGGYGYMEEYPIARFYRDVRAHTIYAGTSEIMKLIIARRLGF